MKTHIDGSFIFAVVNGGNVIVPIDTETADDGLLYILNETDAACILYSMFTRYIRKPESSFQGKQRGRVLDGVEIDFVDGEICIKGDFSWLDLKPKQISPIIFLLRQ